MVIYKRTKLPHIGSIVVSQSDGECGRGIASIVKDLELERSKVKQFDWSTVEFGFNSYIAKAKVHKKELETTRKKLSYDEAKTRFFEYWKSIKDEVPLSSTQAQSIRSAMIQHVCNGSFPEEALSIELRQLSGKIFRTALLYISVSMWTLRQNNQFLTKLKLATQRMLRKELSR
ncbi:hypothetical protein ACVT98_09500 [Vibrio campbellii]